MLYTFTVNEAQLDRITDYLDRQYMDRPDQYIFAVQRSLIEDRIVVIVDCSEKTAVILELMS
jgi:MoxR-like ATPase